MNARVKLFDIEKTKTFDIRKKNWNLKPFILLHFARNFVIILIVFGKTQTLRKGNSFLAKFYVHFMNLNSSSKNY